MSQVPQRVIQQALSCEKSRIIGTVAFQENQVISMLIPKDTVYKGFYIRLSGAVRTTFASGTPVAKAESIMDSLINRIDVVIDGGNTIKSVRPHLLHIQQLFANGIASERASSAGAAAATDNFPTTEGGFVFGTTTQYTTVRETVYLPFEMIYAEPGMGRENTYLNTRNVNSAELKFSTTSFGNLLGTGNTAPVTWDANTLQIEVVSVERQDIPGDVVFDIWKQTMKSVFISGESRDLATEINPGNFLTGLMLFAQDGAAGTATTATGKLASNLLLTNVELKMNGQQTIQRSSFKALAAKNRAIYGVNAPFASGVSRLDGIGHLNLLSRRDLGTAMPAMKPIVDNLQLFLDTNTASNVSYTNPAQVTILTEELIKLSKF
jgi:hypothetical protein